MLTSSCHSGEIKKKIRSGSAREIQSTETTKSLYYFQITKRNERIKLKMAAAAKKDSSTIKLVSYNTFDATLIFFGT